MKRWLQSSSKSVNLPKWRCLVDSVVGLIATNGNSVTRDNSYSARSTSTNPVCTIPIITDRQLMKSRATAIGGAGWCPPDWGTHPSTSRSWAHFRRAATIHCRHRRPRLRPCITGCPSADARASCARYPSNPFTSTCTATAVTCRSLTWKWHRARRQERLAARCPPAVGRFQLYAKPHMNLQCRLLKP